MRRRVPALLVCLSVLPAYASRQGIPDDDALVASGTVVGQIEIHVGDVFDTSDPKENNALFRAANAVHPRTREAVIRRLLLFHEGEPYEPRLLRESERLLRAQGYLYDAAIEPARVADGRVDVVVRTRDVWTLSGGIGFGRKGGKNSVRVGVEDSNFLGFGKEVTLRRIEEVDRTRVEYRYRDRNLAGRRIALTALYSDNSDGSTKVLAFGRQFYALDARWEAQADGIIDDQIDALYDRGEVVARFRHERTAGRAWWGFSSGLRGGRAVRWRAGAAWEKARFTRLSGETPPDPFPADRTQAYPWLGVEIAADGWIEARDLDRIVRTEDLNLARQASASLGWSAPAFGGDRGRAMVEASWSDGRRIGGRQIVQGTASVTGRWGGGRAENAKLGGSFRWFLRNFGGNAFAFTVGGEIGSNLDVDAPLELGGDNGLRGFPLRYAVGNRRVLATLEQRFYFDREFFHLFHAGAAAFVDAGRAWWSGPRSGDPGWLSDVGVGLRVGSSRSSRGAMMHLDVAYPLGGDTDIPRLQFLVTSRETF